MAKIAFLYKIFKGNSYPIIPIQIHTPEGYKEVEGYVDSGATVSIFTIKEAERLKINYQKGKTIYSTVGDGSIIPVYLHKLKVKIGSYQFKATVGFSPRLGVGFNLIGRQDFFTHFDITFSDTTRTITFLPQS
ncbi:MAG: retroviral-like aspartic protease family protein [Candidatus Omnitrophica bacterium]|nr:retroviral-like aspartic protease family protein [Candidatus Omnitrophota bacterium]MBU0896947.1 retroviral-like aspartic protease family protein [Candidatus Omnitrophota bacterium]MBU1367801.1 retroviral-like aspartic protease family protein [Candidatus Omnitrophota bacterium]MBU1809853.1 retroviral-like aspartic protease family protein [Candidatus Omnitrophota bacterium]